MTHRDDHPHRVIVLDSGRHPFELWSLFVGLVVGTPLLWGAPPPGSTAELLGPVWAPVWGYLLVLGCGLALVGVWWSWWAWLGRYWSRVKPQHTTGLLTEQVGLVSVGVATLIFTVGVLAAPATEATRGGAYGRVVAAGLIASLGLASLWRAWQIRRWIQETIRRVQGR
jgi:hypothetical protein